MTGKVVNLRQARKRKSRECNAKAADANAVLHGLSKEARKLNEARNDKASRNLDGHKREDS